MYSEDGTLFREVMYERGPEGELTGIKHLMVPTLNYEYEATYEHDAQYRVTKVTDGRGYPTKYEYDDVGNLIKLYLPSGIGTTESAPNMIWGYDDDHNLTSRLDGKGVLTEYVLDSEDSHLTDVKYDGVTRFHFDFDIYGRLTGTNDYSGQTGQLAYAYDDQDLPQTATTTYPAPVGAKDIAYTHFPDGSRKSMTTPKGALEYTYLHDTTGPGMRITVDPNAWTGVFVTHYYNHNGQIVRQLQDLTTEYTWDARGLLKRQWNTVTYNSSTISDFSAMTYDAAGNRVHANISIPQFGSAVDRSGDVTYGYDFRDRLISEERTLSAPSGIMYSNLYTPDAADNFSPFAGLSFTFNPKNQTSAGSFDDNGNATSYSPLTGRSFGLGYDVENQPTSVSGGRTSLEMAYRPDGLRAWKQPSGQSGSRTWFLYDGGNVVCDLDSTGAVKAAYAYGPNGLAQSWISPRARAYAFDPQGSLVQMSIVGGTYDTAFTSLYDAFGKVWWYQGANTGAEYPSPPPVGYVGQRGVYTDQETRPTGTLQSPLPLMGVRYYDPITGRFLARDPIGDGLNWYSYANGNPVRYIDPTGESAWDTIKAGAAWVVGLPERAAVGAVRAAGKVLSRGTKIDKNKGIAADIRRARTANNDLKGIDPALDAVIARNQQAPGKAGKAYYEQTTQAAGIALLAVATTINWGNQNKHLLGRNLESDKSIVTVPESRIPGLIQQFTGKGVPNTKAFKFGQPGYREIVDFGENIGLVWDHCCPR